MKQLILITISMIIATSLIGQTSTYNPDTGETITDNEYAERILGLWHLTDQYGSIIDADGNESWGFVNSESYYSYEFTSDSLIVMFKNKEDRESYPYKIDHDILTIGEGAQFFIAYINERYNELMLFTGYQNSEHFKFNKNIQIKTDSFHSLEKTN